MLRFFRPLFYSSNIAKPKLLIRSSKKKGVRDVLSADDASSVSVSSVITAPSAVPLKAIAFCTAESFDFSALKPLLLQNYTLKPFLADDVFHIAFPESENDAFVFMDGTFVTWGASEDQISTLSDILSKVEQHKYSDVETETYDYINDNTQPGGVTTETIIIGSDLAPEQTKLACSSGLSKSVKLAILESLLETHLSKNRLIPQLLLTGKKLKVTQSEVLSNVGELFLLRGQLNFHSDLLDSPDFCWSSVKMEDYFNRICRNLDLKARIAVFNKKLDYANEIAGVLRSHLVDNHSLKLEWFIIVLITVEVMFEVLHWSERFQHRDFPLTTDGK